MKVIKKNEVETSEYPKRIVCDHCGAELEYDKDDEFVGIWGMKCITCPECNVQRRLFCWRSSCRATKLEDNL